MASDDEDEQQAGDDHAGPTSSADEAEFVAEEAPQTNWAVHDVARLPDGVGRRSVAVPELPAGVYLVRPVRLGVSALRLAVVR